jgi:predicted kinase
MMKFAITVGLSHSGKSLFSKWAYNTQRYMIIDTNKIREAMIGKQYDFVPSVIIDNYVRQTAVIMAKHFISLNQNVLIDDENLTVEARRVWCDTAKELRTPLTIFWINTPASISIKQNMLFGSIPEKIMDAKIKSLQYPRYSESKMISWIFVTQMESVLDELTWGCKISKLQEVDDGNKSFV